MLTEYGRIREYVDGIRFHWFVEKKELRIMDNDGNVVFLPRRKIPTLQRFLVSIQHLPKTKLKEKNERQ